MKKFKILAINPGSTSTKIGVYINEKPLFEKTIRHQKEQLDLYNSSSGNVLGQKEIRKQGIVSTLLEYGVAFSTLDAVVGRAGRLPPIPSGTYYTSEDMLKDVPDPLVHVALLGAIIAKEFSESNNIPGFFVDPTNVDEVDDICRITGIPEIKREIVSHCLNQKAVARRRASEIGKKYNECNFVVAHMGGGISLGAHHRGRMIDVVNPSNGEGPMSPERAGFVPAKSMIDLCKCGKYTTTELKQLFMKNGGLFAYTGTNNFVEIEKKYKLGIQPEKLLFEAMAYQVAKSIGSMASVLKYDVDGIILTGGLAYSKELTKLIEDRVFRIAQVSIYPGENEIEALALGALRVLRGEEQALVYESQGPVKE